TVPVGLVPQVGNAFQPLVLYLVGDVLDQVPLVHLVGKLCNNNPYSVLAELLEIGLGPDYHLAPAGGVGGTDAASAHDNASRGEVRAGDMLHKVRQAAIRVIQLADAGVDDLPQVVGRDVGGHTHGDAGGAVYQQVGEPAGQDSGLFPGFVKVGGPVHRVLVNVPEHLGGGHGK